MTEPINPASTRAPGSRRLLLPVLLSGSLLLLFGALSPALAAGFQVVVHADRPETSISEPELSRLFFKQATRWDDGSKVVPIDQDKGSAVRAAFLDEVHAVDENGYAKYWVKVIFSGRGQPPIIVSGDASVLSVVAKDPAAIGYVSKGASLPNGVKTLEISN